MEFLGDLLPAIATFLAAKATQANDSCVQKQGTHFLTISLFLKGFGILLLLQEFVLLLAHYILTERIEKWKIEKGNYLIIKIMNKLSRIAWHCYGLLLRTCWWILPDSKSGNT